MKKRFCAALALMLLMALALTAQAGAAQPGADPATSPGAFGAGDGAPLPGGDSGLEGEPLPPPEGEDFDEDEAFWPDSGATLGPDRDVKIDGRYAFTCPGALASVDIEPQDMADGLLFSAFSDTMGVDIYKYEQGEDTLDTLYAACLEDESLEEVALADIGGVKALVYRIDETGINVTIGGDAGFLYDIMLTYETPEEYQQVGAMIASIRKVEA